MRILATNARGLCAGLAALGLFLAAAADSHAQGFPTSSPGLNLFLRNLTPAARQHAVNALLTLTPAGAGAVERFRDSQPPGRVILAARGTSNIHSALPPWAQQRFINGVFGVSVADRQFSDAITQQFVQLALQRARMSVQFSHDAMNMAEQIRQAMSTFRIQ